MTLRFAVNWPPPLYNEVIFRKQQQMPERV